MPLAQAAPDPSLARTNPAQYTAEKAQHEAVVAELERVLQMGAEVKQAAETLSQADHQRLLQEENQKLIEQMPTVASADGREKFFKSTLEAAQKLGFSEDEVANTTDHRHFMLAYWAGKGMEAEQARKKVTAKAAKAPPAAPNRPARAAAKNRNDAAMQKLTKSGDRMDALAVDFE